MRPPSTGDCVVICSTTGWHDIAHPATSATNDVGAAGVTSYSPHTGGRPQRQSVFTAMLRPAACESRVMEIFLASLERLTQSLMRTFNMPRS